MRIRKKLDGEWWLTLNLVVCRAGGVLLRLLERIGWAYGIIFFISNNLK